MPRINYIMKVKYGYVQEWEFESEDLNDLEAIVSLFSDFLAKPSFNDVSIVITPCIIEEELSDE